MADKLPTLHKLGKLYTWRPTEEARKVEAAIRASGHTTKAVEHTQVHRTGVRMASRQGLFDPTLNTVRGFYTIQFGKYQGQSFYWLLENDLGYVTYLLCQVESEGGNPGPGAMNDNKRELKLYVTSFPEGNAALTQRRSELQASKLRTKSPSTPRKAVGRTKRKRSPIAANNPLVEGEIEDVELLSQVEAIESTQSEKSVKPSQPSESASSSSTTHFQAPEKYPIPEGWRDNLPTEDQKWISSLCHYNHNGKLEFCPTQLWHYPPSPQLIASQVPRVDRYFAHRLFVWMPRRFFRVQIHCPDPKCNKAELTAAGLYRTVRRVLDVADFYYMVTEYLKCPRCGKKYISWSAPIVQQLDEGHRRLFQVILTYRYACDIKVVTLMAARGLGNSASQLHRKLEEQHRQQWLNQSARYLTDCTGFTDSTLVLPGTFAEPPQPLPLPKAQWLLTVYCLDVLSRVEEVKAAITSTFGTVLKLDSTKKIVRKLAGYSQKTASWCTNVGNEDGQVLMSVLTCEEGFGGLGPMVEGIVRRYAEADVDPPKALYVDRDCCGQSFTSRLFSAWPDLPIRLDIWHFMRRFSAGCSTDSHQLYGVFMSRLSKCIFEWSRDDLKQLQDAKRSELQRQHVNNPSDDDVIGWLSKKELALHCRRRTRGLAETTHEIEKLLEMLMGDAGRDTLGVPLFDNEKMSNIWESQKRHVACIQDPEGVSLYTQTGTLKKGSVLLKTYRCSRGSTSLESFHLHLNKFIPGNSASDTHFQAYLLEGLRRWNEDRGKQRNNTTERMCTSYSGLLQHAVNELSVTVLKKKLIEDFIQPRKYTGEKIGVEYLYSQTGKVLQDFTADPDLTALQQFDDTQLEGDEVTSDDEGFEDDLDDPTQPPLQSDQLSQNNERPSSKTARKANKQQHTSPEQADLSDHTPDQPNTDEIGEATGPHNIGGFNQVDQLAQYLFTIRDQTSPISKVQADRIIDMWDQMSDYDKQPTVPSPRHRTRLTKGSATTFKVRAKPSCVPGVDSVKRAFHGTEGGAAQRPDSNRYMELLVIKLCTKYHSPIKKDGKKIDRWSQISRAYRRIRELISDCTAVMEASNITLYSINNATLLQWYNKRSKDQEKRMLEQNLRLPEPRMVAETALPPPAERHPVTQTASQEDLYQYSLPPITVGLANVRRRVVPSESPANPESLEVRQNVTMSKESCTPRVTQLPNSPIPASSTSGVARSTKWYYKQREKKKAAGQSVKQYSRRRESATYTCSKCKQVRDDKHTQYYGQWFCPYKTNQTLNEWKAERAEARREKKAAAAAAATTD